MGFDTEIPHSYDERLNSTLNRLSDLKRIQDSLLPYIGQAEKHREENEKESEEAREKAIEYARADLKGLHDIDLPEGLSPEASTIYIDRMIDSLKLGAIPQLPDLNVVDLIDQNELMQCVYLMRDGAKIASCSVGQVFQRRSPFKNPRGTTFRRIDEEVHETTRHAMMQHLDTVLGISWSFAASTKGGLITPIGVGGWSAKMRSAASIEELMSRSNTASGFMATQSKTMQVIMSMAHFTLADQDWELTPEFENCLEKLYDACNSEWANDETTNKMFSRVFDSYGTHLPTNVLLGGRYKIECHITDEAKNLWGENELAIAAALNAQASGAAAGAGLNGVFQGATSASIEAMMKRNESYKAIMEEKYHSIMTDISVTGGAPGNISRWMDEIRKSNRAWEVIDRRPTGLRPIWDLVRKSKKLDKNKRKVVSDRMKKTFDDFVLESDLQREKQREREQREKMFSPIWWTQQFAIFFKGNQFWKYSPNEDKFEGPFDLAVLHPDLPSDINAILVLDRWGNGKSSMKDIAFFFTGDSYLKFSLKKWEVVSGLEKISEGFPGLPENTQFDCVFSPYSSRNTEHGKDSAYFFRNDSYYKFCLKDWKIYKNCPMKISEGFRSNSCTSINAVLQFGFVHKKSHRNVVFFFKGNEFWRFSLTSDTMDPSSPKKISNWFPLLKKMPYAVPFAFDAILELWNMRYE